MQTETPPTQWKDQRTPALAIVARGDQIRSVGRGAYVIQSQSHPDQAYTVTVQRGAWSCECDHHASVGRECIHILAARLREDLRGFQPTDAQRPSCDSCGSAKVVKNGQRRNDSGTVTRWKCKPCNHRFTDAAGFLKRRSDPEKIALALDLYFRGLSVRKVAEHFQHVHDLPVSHMTVYRWVRHYGRLAAEWMDKQGARSGARWHVDETVLKVDGEARYLWNVLDANSRFLLATHVSQNRSLDNTRAPLKKAKGATPDRPRQVFTDGMNAYATAVRKELGHRGGSGTTGYVNPHYRVPSIRAPESNNRVERLHGSEKERTKIMRGFDQDDGCADLMEGWRVHYNLVRTHQALGTTPGEAAGLAPISGFRWLTLLKTAAREP